MNNCIEILDSIVDEALENDDRMNVLRCKISMFSRDDVSGFQMLQNLMESGYCGIFDKIDAVLEKFKIEGEM